VIHPGQDMECHSICDAIPGQKPGRKSEGSLDRRILIAGDHAGIDMKQTLVTRLSEDGYTVTDLGTKTTDSVDYPDFAEKLANGIAAGDAERGILVCGTGIGISIAANRHSHIRAALCHNSTDARLSRQHNDANVIALGARTMGIEVALECVKAFLDTDFEGGRHARRVAKLSPDTQET